MPVSGIVSMRLVVLAQQILAVVVAVRRADDGVDVTPARDARASTHGHHDYQINGSQSRRAAEPRSDQKRSSDHLLIPISAALVRRLIGAVFE